MIRHHHAFYVYYFYVRCTPLRASHYISYKSYTEKVVAVRIFVKCREPEEAPTDRRSFVLNISSETRSYKHICICEHIANSTPFSLKNYSKFAKSSRNFFPQQEVSNYFFVYSTFNFILLFYNITEARLVLGSWHACTDVEKYLCVLCDEGTYPHTYQNILINKKEPLYLD